MRRLGVAAVAALVCAPPAAAHPGHAPPTVGIALYEYKPETITVVAGDLVQWSWDGPDVDHSVTSDASSTEQFDSGVLNKQGATFSYFFATAGTYSYHCTQHKTMHGKVVVKPGAATDTVAPRLRHVRGSVRRGRAVVSFRVSEKASVTARVRRAGGKVLRQSYRFVGKGKARTRVSLHGLGRGRFRVSVYAEDATGNRSKPAVVDVTR